MSRLNLTAAQAVTSRRIPSAVVGSGRVLKHNGDCIQGELHGHVLVKKWENRVVLQSHGFRTARTRIAMQGFLTALGVNARVSFAEGKFTVRLGEKTFEATGDILDIAV